MIVFKRSLIFVLSLMPLIFVGCVSTHEPSEDYQEIATKFNSRVKKRVPILMVLVDGLGARLFQDHFDQFPSLTDYFRVKPANFPMAHSIFPSLTFPNLVSLLSRMPSHRHSVIGNQMRLSNGEGPGQSRFLNFEKRDDLVWLNSVKAPSLVFTQLSQLGRPSASFAQSLFAGASITQTGDLGMALAYKNKDYLAIDRKNIQSLLALLNANDPQDWPDFMFLHLIGVDALAHDLGPSHPSVHQYMKKLDEELVPLWAKLLQTERRGHHVASLVTADHGFTEVKKVFDLDSLNRQTALEFEVINEGRHASIFFDKGYDYRKETLFIEALRKLPAIQWIVSRRDSVLILARDQSQWRFEYLRNFSCQKYHFAISFENQSYCPDELYKIEGRIGLPAFALANLLSYMQAPQRPDAVLLAAQNVSFTNQHRGHHGGVSEDEVLVPLLLRGISVRGGRTPALFELLNVLSLPSL